jgi:predicted transcriptional regulator
MKPNVDASNLNERDRKTVEKMQQQKADFEIVEGLLKKNHGVEEIATMMGEREASVRVIANKLFRAGKIPGKTAEE